MFDRRNHRSLDHIPRTSSPVWPLPSLDGRDPVVIPANGSKVPGHELAYERTFDGELATLYPAGSVAGTDKHFMPSSVPVFAVGDGVITYAGKQMHGHAVIVDHGFGWATYYANLEHMFAQPTNSGGRPRPVRVKAGDVIGYVGAPWPDTMRQLHFELWRLDADGHYEPVDALGFMRSWLLLPWTDERLPGDSANLPAAA